jgi:P-type conjugative transfer protein TrbJ
METSCRKRRNSLAFAALIAVASLSSSVPLRAQVVQCLNCSTIAQQLLGYARQFLQLQQEVRIAEYEVQNTLNLPNNLFQSAASDINRLVNLSHDASLLAGNSGTFINNLAADGYPLSDDWTEIVREQNSIAQAMRALGNVLNLQPSQLTNYSQTFGALQNQAMSAEGRQQTQQVLSGLVAATGHAIQTSQANVTTGLQALAAYDLSEADRKAAALAEAWQFGEFDPDPTSGYQGF